MFRAEEVYHKEPSRQELLVHVDATNLDLPVTPEDQELVDATITRGERELLKEEVRAAEARLSSHALMYLAGAFEDAARRKRGAEENETRSRRTT